MAAGAYGVLRVLVEHGTGTGTKRSWAIQIKDDRTGHARSRTVFGFSFLHVPGITTPPCTFYKMAIMSNYLRRLLW